MGKLIRSNREYNKKMINATEHMRLLCGNPQIGEKTTGPLGYQNVYYNSVYKWVQPPRYH